MYTNILFDDRNFCQLALQFNSSVSINRKRFTLKEPPEKIKSHCRVWNHRMPDKKSTFLLHDAANSPARLECRRSPVAPTWHFKTTMQVFRVALSWKPGYWHNLPPRPGGSTQLPALCLSFSLWSLKGAIKLILSSNRLEIILINPLSVLFVAFFF